MLTPPSRQAAASSRAPVTLAPLASEASTLQSSTFFGSNAFWPSAAETASAMAVEDADEVFSPTPMGTLEVVRDPAREGVRVLPRALDGAPHRLDGQARLRLLAVDRDLPVSRASPRAPPPPPW